MIESRSPCLPRHSLVLSHLPLVEDIRFWLVVVFFYVSFCGHLRPDVFLFLFVFAAQFATPNDSKTHSLHVPPWSCAFPDVPPNAETNFLLIVVFPH
jgi:hypothetical protein